MAYSGTIDSVASLAFSSSEGDGDVKGLVEDRTERCRFRQNLQNDRLYSHMYTERGRGRDWLVR